MCTQHNFCFEDFYSKLGTEMNCKESYIIIMKTYFVRVIMSFKCTEHHLHLNINSFNSIVSIVNTYLCFESEIGNS